MFLTTLTGLLFLAVACSGKLIPRAQPAPTPAITLAPRDAPSAATITLAALSEYEIAADKPASPTGSDLKIVARSQPTDGVDIFLGPDLKKQVTDIIHSKCGDQKASDCESSVQTSMDPQQVGLQARSVLLLALVGIWAAGIISAGVIAMVKANKDAGHYHIPEADINQISSASAASASSIVIATTAGDSNPITIVPVTSLAAQPTGGVTVSTVSADGNDYKKGDVVLSVKDDLGQRLADYFGMKATCSQKKIKARQVGGCAVTDATNLMREAGPNGAFRDLVILPNQHLPTLRPGDLLNALNAVIAAGRAMTFLALNSAGVDALAEVCFWIAYDKGVQHVPNLIEWVIPDIDISSKDDNDNDDDKNCPEPEHEPLCSNCGGDAGGGKCNGIVEAEGAWKGCPCGAKGDFPYRPFPDQQAILDAQSALANIPTLTTPSPFCTFASYPFDHSYTVVPSAYCACGIKYASYYTTTGGNNPCPYTSDPGNRITLTNWVPNTVSGSVCSYPSTATCATYNTPRRRGLADVGVATAAPVIDKRQGGPGMVCFNQCPTNPGPVVAAQTCSCAV